MAKRSRTLKVSEEQLRGESQLKGKEVWWKPAPSSFYLVVKKLPGPIEDTIRSILEMTEFVEVYIRDGHRVTGYTWQLNWVK